MVNHRGPEFRELINRVTGGLQSAFETDNDMLILTASGTGGLEAAIVNFLSARAIRCSAVRSARSVIASPRSLDLWRQRPTKIDVEWGHAAEPAQVGSNAAR